MIEKESIIKEFIKTILEYDLKDLLKDEMYIEAKTIFIIKAKEFLISEDMKNILYNYVEDRMDQIEKKEKSLKDILPKGFENSLKVLAYNKGPEIMSYIKEFINNDKFKNNIKLEINKFMNGINPMVSKFVNPDSIYNKIVTSLNSHLDDSENMMTIVMEINKKIDEGANKSVSQITNYIPYEGKISFIRGLVDNLLDFILEDAYIKQLVDRIEAKIIKYDTIGKLIDVVGINEEKIYNRL